MGSILPSHPFLSITFDPSFFPPADEPVNPQPGRDAQQEKGQGNQDIMVADSLEHK